MSFKLFALPFRYSDWPEGRNFSNEINANFPNKNCKEFKQLNNFSDSAFQKVLATSKFPNLDFVFEGKNGGIAVSIIDDLSPYDFSSEVNPDLSENAVVNGIVAVLKTLVCLKLGILHQTGFIARSEIRKISKINISVEDILNFLCEVRVDDLKYKGNEGQIRCAKELGEMHLGHLYSLASGLGLIDQLEWTKMDVPFKKIGEFLKLVVGSNNQVNHKYIGNQGQLLCAKELGEMNLGHLYSLASGLGLIDQLGWTRMDVPFKKLGEFSKLVVVGPNNQVNYKYIGNQGQLLCAKELGEMHLGHLHSLASGLGLIDQLGWTNMDVPFKKVGEFSKLVVGPNNQVNQKYIGNQGQLLCAKELGESNLGQLYSLASGLGLIDQLGWTKMDVPFKKLGEFLNLVVVGPNNQVNQKYIGNQGQLLCAKELGESNLTQLYSLASGLGLIDQLEWTKMDVPFKKIGEFLNLVVVGSNNQVNQNYIGNQGQLLCTKELGEMHLGQLYSLASGLGLIDQLEWTKMDVPFNKVGEFSKLVVGSNNQVNQNYIGNQGQLLCAKELGEMHLGHLYSLASGLGLIDQLEWTKMDVPFNKVGEFSKLVVGSNNQVNQNYIGNQGQLLCAKELGEMNLGHLYSLASGLGLIDQLGWTKMDVPFNKVGEFSKLVVVAPNNQVNHKYIGNQGQLLCAKELGESNLAQLYSLASGLGLIDQLGWTNMDVPFKKLGEFLELVVGSNNQVNQKYIGNQGQLLCAKELGEMHLGQLYSLASGLGLIDQLGWTNMDVPFKKLGEFLELVVGPNNQVNHKYIGNQGQLLCAKELGEMHLGQLYSLASGLGLIDQLGWTEMNVPFNKVGEFSKLVVVGSNNQVNHKYIGNQGQLLCAKELGKMHLVQLYSLASGLGLIDQLGWTEMNVPFNKVGEFSKLVVVGSNNQVNQKYIGNQGQLLCAKELGEMHLGHLYSLASGLGLIDQLGWTKMKVPFNKVGEFLKLIVVGPNNQVNQKYIGNQGQLLCAKELGEMHLGHLYSLASGLGLIDQLGWTKMKVPFNKVGEFLKLIVVGPNNQVNQKYIGNQGQLLCAKELGESNLAQLYSLASGLGYVKKLRWKSRGEEA